MTQTAETPIDQQRAALEGKLAELQDMAGLPIDLVRQAQQAVQARRAEMANVEQQLAELDAITGARARQQRADAEQARLARLASQRKELVELEEQRLAAIADAEAGIRQAADAIRRALECNAALARVAYALSGQRGTPPAMSEPDLVNRLAARISGIMATIGKSYRGRLGGLALVGVSRFPVDQSWRDAEERMMAPSIVSLVEKDH